MPGLNQFRHLPQTLKEWSRWMRDQDIENSLGNPDATERVLTSDTDGNREWVRRFDRWPAQFRGATNQDLGTTAITVDLVTTDYDPGVHYSLSNDQVLIGMAGYYKVTYEVFASVDTLAGSTTCNLRGSIHKNGAAVVGSYSAAYLNETGLWDTSCGTSVLVLCSAGDALRLRARVTAAMDVSTVANRCKLIIERVR